MELNLENQQSVNMIVSGFTQKSVTIENPQGSALDHSHCMGCYSRKCKVSTNGVSSCDVIECPRGCSSLYHGCKDGEHALLCPEEKVTCINSDFGCPAMVIRKKLADHLTACPANIVHCRAEWNRYNLEPVRPGEKPPLNLKKVYADCGQLDTALALRDHRALVDRHLSPQQSAMKTPDIPIPVDLAQRWDTSFQQLKRKAAAPGQQQDTSRGGSASELHSVLDQAGPSSAEAGSSALKDAPGGGREGWEPREEVLQDGQPMRSILNHSLSLESISRCQPKPRNVSTFVCAQDMRRGEFPHHHWAVHDRLQSDLGGWMEQRCPLAYLGCPFSFRRLRPGLPGNVSLRHSALLESFGVTVQPPHTDLSHQTPAHLLPAFAQTADDGPDSTSEHSDHPQSIEHNRIEQEPEPSAARAQNCQGDHVPVFSDPSAPSPCPQGSQPTEEDSFSSLLDSISLEEGKTHQELQPKQSHMENGLPASNVSGQAKKAFSFNQEDHGAENTPFTSQNNSEEDSNIQSASCASLTTPDDLNSNNLSTTPTTTSKKTQSFSSSLACVPAEEGQKQTIIYTGTCANSCIRIDNMDNDASSLPLDSDTGTEDKDRPQLLQLSDLPSEIVRYIMRFLDSFSLYSLSLVSHGMRDLCCTLLQDRGMVALVWAKRPPPQQPHPISSSSSSSPSSSSCQWNVVGKRWSFSTCFDPVTSWQFTGHNPIPTHLATCPYNQDRLRHSQAFSIIPESETPLNIQIRDTLQTILQRYRNFRGWIIRSNFDRELVTAPRPFGALAETSEDGYSTAVLTENLLTPLDPLGH